jgi:AraC family transcriptional regulator, regulatory protein of adaptative response / methylated-DNA-[protein]-cysteine methyltransferase
MRASAGIDGRRMAILGDPRWASVVARDRAADGTFFYSVATTGVYCRPSCPSRQARPENVRFHATLGDAEQAGFRPCKRCRPAGPALEAEHAATIVLLCRRIEQAETMPSLAGLAQEAGLSPAYVHRLFKAVTGLTPKAYADAHRARRVRAALAAEDSVTGATFAAGFNSSGRFYHNSNAILGMTPTRFRSGGADMAIRFAVGGCSLGSVLVASSDRGVCAILLGDHPAELEREVQELFPRATLTSGDHAFAELVASVVGMIDGSAPAIDLPLDIRGTVFQQRIWQALREIPPGTRTTYRAIADRLGIPRAVRAVAGACAANRLAVVIPCHRVVGSDGSLCGYRWGLERKRALLERESGN